jgi:D-alanine-D-alanine ligase
VNMNLKIMVLAGGLSEEREVSLASARAISESLVRLGYNISVIDAASGQTLLDDKGHYLYAKDTASSSTIALVPSSSTALTRALELPQYADIDVVFLALHGGAGEDGTIQSLLKLAGKKYTGSNVLASAIAMNKGFAKRLVKYEGILTPEWMILKLSDKKAGEDWISAILDKFALPFIIKPNDSGSTVGLTLVKDAKELGGAIDKAFEVSKEVIVEQYIKGREITAAVLNGEPLPLVEIVPTNELYDYQCKYTKGKSQYICPAELPEAVKSNIQKMAGRAYEVIGCSGLARADFILDAANKPYFLEVNTLPGMTELSLAPMAAKAAGISFDDLVRKICEAALNE